jgi:chromosome segregation ATPase
LRGEAKFYKEKLDSTKDKLKEKTAEYQNLHEYLKTVQKNMEHMNLNLQETASHPGQRQMAESYNADQQAHLVSTPFLYAKSCSLILVGSPHIRG